MKKIMTMAVIAVACTVASAAEITSKTWRTAPAADFRAAYESVLAQTNLTDMTLEFHRHLAFMTFRADLADLRAEADEALSARGVAAMWSRPVEWPRMSALDQKRLGIATNYPNSVALWRKYGVGLAMPTLSKAGITLSEAVSVLEDYLVCKQPCLVGNIAQVKQYIQQSAEKTIRRQMRINGMSFVTKDGVNPVQEALNALSSALDAPRLAGLNEWFARYGYDAKIDVSRLPSEADVAVLRDAVFYGDRTMSKVDACVLYLCLGVNGYNAFVKEYNGDKE